MVPKDMTQTKARELQERVQKTCTSIYPRMRYPRGEDEYGKKIYIESVADGCNYYIHAIALIDTGCRINIMSRSMAEHVGAVLPAHTDTPSLFTLGSSEFKSVGCIDRRWIPARLGFGKGFYTADWEVAEGPNKVLDCYDVVIGTKTQAEYGLVKLSSILG